MSAPITEVAGHVLLPHQADWSEPPSTRRSWRSGVVASQDGDEERSSLLPASWQLYRYQVLPYDHAERAVFDMRFMTALRRGKVAVPMFGSGVPLGAAVDSGDDELVLERSGHGLVAGQFVLLQTQVPQEWRVWDLCYVTGVAGATVAVEQPVGSDYPEDAKVWPLLLGRPVPEDFEVLNLSRARHTVAVQFDQRQGLFASEEAFDDYVVGPAVSLAGGQGWDGEWDIANN